MTSNDIEKEGIIGALANNHVRYLPYIKIIFTKLININIHPFPFIFNQHNTEKNCHMK